MQRVMAARSLSHAKGGTIMAGYAKILPLFIIIFPGKHRSKSSVCILKVNMICLMCGSQGVTALILQTCFW